MLFLTFQVSRPLSMKKDGIQTRNRKLSTKRKKKRVVSPDSTEQPQLNNDTAQIFSSNGGFNDESRVAPSALTADTQTQHLNCHQSAPISGSCGTFMRNILDYECHKPTVNQNLQNIDATSNLHLPVSQAVSSQQTSNHLLSSAEMLTSPQFDPQQLPDLSTLASPQSLSPAQVPSQFHSPQLLSSPLTTAVINSAEGFSDVIHVFQQQELRPNVNTNCPSSDFSTDLNICQTVNFSGSALDPGNVSLMPAYETSSDTLQSRRGVNDPLLVPAYEASDLAMMSGCGSNDTSLESTNEPRDLTSALSYESRTILEESQCPVIHDVPLP